MIYPTHPRRVYAMRKRKKGFTLIELTVVMAVLGILLAAGLYGFNQYIQNAQGSTCTQQLADISRACNSLSAILNWTTAAQASGLNATLIAPYLGNRTVNGPAASDINCPAGGPVYTLPTAFVGATTQMNDPICGWVCTSVGPDGHSGDHSGTQGAAFAGTRLHSLGQLPFP